MTGHRRCRGSQAGLVSSQHLSKGTCSDLDGYFGGYFFNQFTLQLLFVDVLPHVLRFHITDLKYGLSHCR